MAGKVHTDSEALYAVRSAITKFAGSFQEAQGNFFQCFEQMNYQVEDHIRMLDSDIESCEEEKRVLQRQVEECEEKQSTAQREQSQHQNGRTDSFVCDRCGTRMMLKIYGDSTSCKSSSGCSGTMHRFFNDGEYHRLNVEIQQLEEKRRQLQERIADLDKRIGKREEAKGRAEKNYSELQMHQQSIMSLLVFGSGEDPETAVAFIDKALASLGDYQAVGFENSSTASLVDTQKKTDDVEDVTNDTSSDGVDNIELVKQHGAECSSSLSADERESLRRYTANSYANINATLRGIDSGFDEGNYENAKNIHSVLERTQLPCDCTVYRGVSSKALGVLKVLPDSLLRGRVFSDKGFLSTSLNPNSAFDGDLILEIHAPAGTNGMYVGYVSSAKHYEEEVLFDINQNMRIDNVRRDELGRRVIEATII